MRVLSIVIDKNFLTMDFIFANKLHRCTMGLRRSWRKKKFNILGIEWTYETAMIAKAGL